MQKELLYNRYAKFYDKLYLNRDYDKEVSFIKSVIDDSKVEGMRLLDMACGTGTHAKKFSELGYDVTGVDISLEMLKIAREKTNKVKFIKGSMQTFKSKRKFDIITCLFSSIHHLRNISKLKSTINNFHDLLNKGGVLIIGLKLLNAPRKKLKKSGFFIDASSDEGLRIVRIGRYRLSRLNPQICNVSIIMILLDKLKFNIAIDRFNLALFDVEDIKSIMADVGFNIKIYYNYSLNDSGDKSKICTIVGKKNIVPYSTRLKS